MLTDNEKHWLQLRKLYEGANHYSYYSCMRCQFYNVGRWYGYKHPCNKACLSNGCPNIDIRSSGAVFDYVEAVEFEARVAAKLADLVKYSVRVCHHSCADCFLCKTNKCHDDDPGNLTCEGTILKYARLAVEEEMDADR